MKKHLAILSPLGEKDNKLLVFSLVTFGLPLVMGIIMAYIYYHQGGSLSAFAGAQMFYPAAGVMLAYLCDKTMKSKVPRFFFYYFLVLTVLMMVYALMNSLCNLPGGGYWEATTIVATLFCYYIFHKTDGNKLEAMGLSFSINWKKTLAYVLLFIVLLFGRIILGTLLVDGTAAFTSEEFNADLSKVEWAHLFFIPINFFLAFLPFLGEEYGWRFFLQPILQNKYGNIRGVFILGIVWALWHLPLDLFYYTTPAHSIQVIISHVIICVTISIFMGYVYIKTKNIWGMALMHCFNNSLLAAFSGGDIEGGTTDISASDFLLGVFIPCILIYLPFLWSKVYRQGNKMNVPG